MTIRPVDHHTVESGWINDPHGLTWHDGRYHLFFQFVPDSTTWDVACRWGHATSEDLRTWHPEPVALEPGGDEDGIWSGCLVRDGDDAVIFYTGVGAADREIGWVRRAVPDDASWRTWTKQEVVVRLPEGERATAFRDPYVFRHGDGWRMLMAGGDDGTPVLWVFTSDDLHTWAYAGRAATGEPGAGIWECPNLVEVDGRTVVVLSIGDANAPLHVAWAFARLHEDGTRLDLGPLAQLTPSNQYAGSVFVDAEGRPGLITWVRDATGDGWAGAHSPPMLLSVVDGQLVARPRDQAD